jgi:hypothetical protein
MHILQETPVTCTLLEPWDGSHAIDTHRVERYNLILENLEAQQQISAQRNGIPRCCPCCVSNQTASLHRLKGGNPWLGSTAARPSRWQ